MNKILFIVKKRSVYSDGDYINFDSGLYNSARLVNEMLVENHVESNLVQVIDNNEIDKYCAMYKPNIVIIEAVWVVPSKFEILKKLHPNITWIVRLHSELPFLANEGIAMQWLKEYVKYDGVYIGSNSTYLVKALTSLLKTDIIHLPNYYNVTEKKWVYLYENSNVLNVGIFGAIRPMKNPLTQAVAAMNYADLHNKKLVLHLNSGRVEQNGDNALKNIRALFVGNRHELVEHDWLNREDFATLVASMDICLQVSLTETYNIVAADAINHNVPVVTSNEIPFVNYFSKVKSNKNVNKMVNAIGFNLKFGRILAKVNKYLLRFNSYKSKKTWMKFSRMVF